MGEITGCEIIKCTDWIDGKCHYDGPCKYHWATFEIAEDEAKDKNIESLRVQLKEKDTRIVELKSLIDKYCQTVTCKECLYYTDGGCERDKAMLEKE